MHRFVGALFVLFSAIGGVATGQISAATEGDVRQDVADHEPTARPTLSELKSIGAQLSSYRGHQSRSTRTVVPKTDVAGFHKDIAPIFANACVQCHGPETQEGNIRIDTLDPDLIRGDDVSWWLEVLAVLGNGEMPPADEATLSDGDRGRIIQWLASEIQIASKVRRAERGHSSFRRMTRYEYNYALQDLLGLPFDFGQDLPPEANSEDGFQNSAEMLHMSAMQFGTYHESARNALLRATVRGERPEPIYWGVSMKAASAGAWESQDGQLAEIREQHKDDADKLEQELERQMADFRTERGGTHYKNLASERTADASWHYDSAQYAWKPTETKPEVPTEFENVAIIPPRHELIVELGNRVPDRGPLRVRVRAARTAVNGDRTPSLQLEFGWQASNDSSAAVKISDRDRVIDAVPEEPKWYQWEVPLSEIYPRNSFRKTAKMGETPNPSELIKLVNNAVSRGDIQIDYVEVTAPVYEQWPPQSHTRIFSESESKADEVKYARELLTEFMTRAWRCDVDVSEVDQKLALYHRIRPECEDFQQAMIEVLATVLSSPRFLYLVQVDPNSTPVSNLRDEELATRLSMFLWCSTPDDELQQQAAAGRLSDREVLVRQVKRMLADPRTERFSMHFVRQWLGMQLLDYLDVDRKVYTQFDRQLKEAMQQEPVAFFHEVLQNNRSVIDFLHADYTLANERLARHYGLNNVFGNEFRRVSFDPRSRRGGLLTQAGLLAMNSDGKDSHPLKRGIWMLESLLNDPPPPPPPAVPEINLADPEIAKLTLKQRIEHHRDHAACMSCHAKIDPWGIAFENFDAVGSWRNEVQGKPVDASSVLFNGQQLEGMDGLKRFLLEHRQDQFVRALVHKMTTFALGRTLTFGDHAGVDEITTNLRKQGDGLATMVTLVVTNELFLTK